jgi:hypothetical protein
MLDLLALVVLALAAWHGWRRGTLLMRARDDPRGYRDRPDDGNPTFRQLMNRGDFTAMANDPRFNDLAGRVMQKLRAR